MSGPVSPPLATTESGTTVRVQPTNTLEFNGADFAVTQSGSKASISIDSTGTGAALTDTHIGFGDSSNLLTGSANFTFVDESGGSGPTVTLTGDKPILIMQDDTGATDFFSEFTQSGASLELRSKDSTGATVEIFRTRADSITFNDDGVDMDFTIKGDSNSNLFTVDAGQDNIGIGASPANDTNILQAFGDAKLDRNSATSNLTRKFTIEGARFDSGADFAQVIFQNYDGAEYEAAEIAARNDPDGVKDGTLVFRAADNDTMADIMIVQGTGANVGIGTTPASGVKLHVRDDESDTDNVVIRIQDGSVDTVGDQVAIEGYWSSAQAGVIFFQLRDVSTAASAIVMKATNDAGSLTEFVRMDGDAKAITFNEQSEDVDFRVETNNDDSILRIVGSTDNVGISTIPDSDALLHIHDDDGSFAATVRIESVDDDAAVGPVVELFKNSASPDTGDDIGQILFTANDSAGAKQNYFQIKAEIRDKTSGSDDGELVFIGPSNSTDVEFMRMSKTVGVVVNEGSTSIVDFRIESSNNIDMFKLDSGLDRVAVGAAPSSTGAQFQVDDDASFKSEIINENSTTILTASQVKNSKIISNPSGSDATITLPAGEAGMRVTVGNVSSSNTVTVAFNASDSSIEGASGTFPRAMTAAQLETWLCYKDNNGVLENFI